MHRLQSYPLPGPSAAERPQASLTSGTMLALLASLLILTEDGIEEEEVEERGEREWWRMHIRDSCPN